MTCLMCRHQLVVHSSGPPSRGHRRCRSSHNFNRFFIFFLMCCCYCTVVVQPLLQLDEEALLLQRRDAAADGQDYYHDDEDEDDASVDEEDHTNSSKPGSYLGAPCDRTCDPQLPHVFCDAVTKHCECEKTYPVKLGAKKGCAKPVRLGDQCFYRQACTFTDQHATCIQINHNAICQCKPGYHTVALQRPTKKVFCSEDMVILTTDAPTLLGVATGLAIFTFLICFVLKLFSRARYSRPRHYANANLAPPILFSSETGIPLAVHGGRPSSRASSQRSVGTIASGFSRRPSSGGSRGVLVPASRAGAARAAAILLISCHLTTTTATAASDQTSTDDNSQPDQEQQQPQQRIGSRRPSIASIHSSGSSCRSYSAKRFEREQMQKEQRKLQLEMQMQMQIQQDNLKPGAAPTPSPKTPMSTDELLPSVSEVREESHHSTPTMNNASSSSSSKGATTSYQGEIGPCTSTDLPPLG